MAKLNHSKLRKRDQVSYEQKEKRKAKFHRWAKKKKREGKKFYSLEEKLAAKEKRKSEDEALMQAFKEKHGDQSVRTVGKKLKKARKVPSLKAHLVEDLLKKTEIK